MRRDGANAALGTGWYLHSLIKDDSARHLPWRCVRRRQPGRLHHPQHSRVVVAELMVTFVDIMRTNGVDESFKDGRRSKSYSLGTFIITLLGDSVVCG
jgi:hypothetical protein